MGRFPPEAWLRLTLCPNTVLKFHTGFIVPFSMPVRRCPSVFTSRPARSTRNTKAVGLDTPPRSTPSNPAASTTSTSSSRRSTGRGVGGRSSKRSSFAAPGPVVSLLDAGASLPVAPLLASVPPARRPISAPTESWLLGVKDVGICAARNADCATSASFFREDSLALLSILTFLGVRLARDFLALPGVAEGSRGGDAWDTVGTNAGAPPADVVASDNGAVDSSSAGRNGRSGRLSD